MSSESRIVVGIPRSLGGTGSIFAYGDRDDPARLVVLLAERVLAVVDPSSNAATDAKLCLERRTTWKQRLQHLDSALHDASDTCDEPFIIFWDVDALASEQDETWDQERSSLLRRDLFRIVRKAAMDGGWILVRTARARRSTLLEDLDLKRETIASDDMVSLPEEARLFAPECWPIAAFLVDREVVRPRDLAEIYRTVDHADQHLVDLAYEALPNVARDAASLLTALRAPQSLNGHFGRIPFDPRAQQTTADALPAQTKDALIAAGLIQPTWPGGPWRMPRIVRNRLTYFAQAVVAGEVDKVHRREASATASSADLLVEAHYHAICVGDIELAKQTAVYYGSELSEVARQLSLSAQELEDEGERRRRFLAAANLFHYVVTDFDNTDAYAWEYYGYNLARGGSSDSTEIRHAYECAYNLRRGNPLYHGRWLGFRAGLGEHVVKEAIDGVRRYALDPPEREPVSFFAEALLRGLWRGRQTQQANELLDACGPLLSQLAPRAMTMAHWAR
jgi:hypothetical protein